MIGDWISKIREEETNGGNSKEGRRKKKPGEKSFNASE